MSPVHTCVDDILRFCRTPKGKKRKIGTMTAGAQYIQLMFAAEHSGVPAQSVVPLAAERISDAAPLNQAAAADPAIFIEPARLLICDR